MKTDDGAALGARLYAAVRENLEHRYPGRYALFDLATGKLYIGNTHDAAWNKRLAEGYSTERPWIDGYGTIIQPPAEGRAQ